MFPYSVVTYVTSFPPAELPAFTGTMMPSDSLCLVCLFFLYYRLSGILTSLQEDTGSPGLPHILNVQHAMVSDPGEARCGLPLTPQLMVTSVILNTSSLPTKAFRGSIPSALRFTACWLAVLRLISGITPFDPRTCYPVVGQPSGTGFSPARMYDLARPHK